LPRKEIVSEKKNRYEFPGENVDVRWDRRLCIHVQECTRAKGEVFAHGREPWGQPDLDEADYVAEVVERCPTGALTYRRKDGGEEETAPLVNRVTIANNGPLYVSGSLEIDGAKDDMPGVRYRAALCRCGESENKPFCDNSHEKVGFVDRAALGETGPGFEEPGGTLEIRRAPDGPLLVNGNHTLVTGAGRERWRGTKSALCRCGESDNKPFCDGSHMDAGFKTE
jgi:CDGSH-type Zn-finger protein/uncharacterized Fe-S cluster protein YjdI